MRKKKNILRYVMLLAGILMLLSVVIPHHHHSNGLPCFHVVTEHSHDHSSTDDCGSNGHGIARFISLLTQATDVAVNQILFPLLVLFDYINPLTPAFCGQTFDRSRAFYIESLHDSWIVSASGLRAPPMY